MSLFYKLIRCFVLLSALTTCAWATHIRSGEITAKRISQSGLRYRFTLTIYRDTEGVEFGQGGIFNFGQGRTIGPALEALRAAAVDNLINEVNIGNNTSVITLRFDHTFDGPGTYVISFTEQNRNANIINLGGASSENLPFHVETVIRIRAGDSPNATPLLTVPPIDRACVGARFVHNPGAFDADGDSLAYKIVTPQQDRGVKIAAYLPLDNSSISDNREDGSYTARFEINAVTGTLTWDAPKLAGEYNIAFVIEEWRFSKLTNRYELLGYVTRDMQIVVEDCKNERPKLEIPPDTCIEAGKLLKAIAKATDPDGNQVLLESFGGVYKLNILPAAFLSLPDENPIPAFRDPPVTSAFRWHTNISHVRKRPYEVQFKVSDRPSDPGSPSLTEFDTWKITVVAPAPTGLKGAIASGNSIQLVWDKYKEGRFNPLMQVYRRVDSFDFNPDNCNVGIPESAGYQLIDELPINQNNYIDKNKLRPGVNYCYRLVAAFPLPSGGTSYASKEFCLTIPLDVPAITNVSVEKTGKENGEIFVRWTHPLEIDRKLFPPPFSYELFRYNGFNSTDGRTRLTLTSDTFFTDTGLNTSEQPFNYQVQFYDADNNLIDSSATASSLRLEAVGELRSVALSWSAEVPWSNQVKTKPYHLIFRNRTDANATDETNFVLIDSVDVTQNGMKYLDKGNFKSKPLLDDRAYCYYVVARGSYGNKKIASPLINKSQILCVQPNDEVPPKKPEIKKPDDPDKPDETKIITGPDGTPLLLVKSNQCTKLETEPCAFANFTNTLSWTVNNTDNDIAGYNIYFSETGAADSYKLIDNTRNTRFEHTGLSDIKGCYRIAAVDRSKNESPLSDPICFDNCPNYKLPNTFTPNNDKVNDTFRAFDQPNGNCPRFVKRVIFSVYNRWGGQEVFYYDSSQDTEPNVFIDWDGRDTRGNQLSSGTYYYTATVTFDTLDPSKRKQEFRNWVKIIR